MEKVAVILVGINKAELIISTVDNNNYFIINDREFENVNLNVSQSEDMFLNKMQIDAAIKILKNFRKICELYGVSRVIAVSTFGDQEKPKNLHSFFDEVFSLCGFRFTSLDNAEQNTVIYSSIINTHDIPKGVICYLDNENLHLIAYNRRVVLDQVTLPLGAKALADKFKVYDADKEAAFNSLKEYLNNELSQIQFLNEIEEDFDLVGVGQFFEDASILAKRLRKYPLDLVNDYNLLSEDNAKVLAQLKQADLDPTKKIKGVKEQRADATVVSLALIETLFELSKKPALIVSTRPFFEGLMFSQVVEQTQDRPLSDVLGFSMMSQSNFFDKENEKHNEQVYNLSLLLFKQLRVLHKLPRGYTRILRLASYMHDCGQRVGFNNHAKNGFYTLLGSDLYGVSHRELVLAGMAISLHCGGDISINEYLKYRELVTEEDIEAVKKLGIILRLAEAFDRVKNSVIVDINCDVLGDSVIMKTIATGDNSYEVEKASECAKDFERCFGKKIEIL